LQRGTTLPPADGAARLLGVFEPCGKSDGCQSAVLPSTKNTDAPEQAHAACDLAPPFFTSFRAGSYTP
jgi:hypothetical protein